MKDARAFKELGEPWKDGLIKSFIPENLFTKGGDKRSAKYRIIKQLAVLRDTQKQALEEPAEANDAVVAKRCTEEVSRRWNSKHPDVLKTVVHTVALRVRRRRREGCLIECEDLLALLDEGLKQQFESNQASF